MKDASNLFALTCRRVTIVAAMLLGFSASSGLAGEAAPAAGSGQPISAEEKQRVIKMMREQIIRCWSPPPGASESGVQATIGMELNQDGTLKSEPRLETLKHPGSPLASSIAASALRAVRMCLKEHPFKLPIDRYDDWKVVHITFDPKSL